MAGGKNLAKNTVLLSIGSILTKGLSFVMVPIFSRLLSTSDYGTFDLVCTYVTILLPLIGLATEEALFRFSMDTDSKEQKSKYVSNSLAVFLCNSVILFFIIVAVHFCAGWSLAFPFFVLALGEIFNLYLRGYLRAIKKINTYSFFSAIITVFIAIYTTIFVKFLNLELIGIILGYGAGYITGDLLIIFFTGFFGYVSLSSISLQGIRELVKYSYSLIPNSIAWWFINVSDRTIINIFLGTAANGIYAISYKIPNILSSVFSVFRISWQQAATETLNDAGRDDFYNKVFNKLIAVIFPLCCGVLSLNSWMFNYLFDARYYEAYLYAPILVGGIVFSSISQFYGSIQISLKRPKENGITTVIGAIFNIIIHLALVKFIGLYAAAISTIASQIIVCILRHKRISETIVLKMNLKSKACIVLYVLFSIAAYYITNSVFNVLIVLLATGIVIYMNEDIVEKMLEKLKIKK